MKHAQLIDKIKLYEPNFDQELIKKAYTFSMRAHESQVRESGDPYFLHPLAVAGIIVDMRLDSATIATALLHDTVEDTLATIVQIEENFGKEVAQLVDGVTKLSQLKLDSVNEKNKEAENFRKLLLAMSNDLRVLLVKLADRLHNMRTLNFISSEKKRKRIATETMDIYAPLAGRIGMHEIKEELEDLAFSELNFKAHSSIIRRLSFLKEEYDNVTSQIKKNLKKILSHSSINSDIVGREKKPFSIWRKMQRKNISFENLSDVVAFRIIVNNIEDCYKALGKIHQNYSLVPDRFKDYISTPKQNGYKSIHTTVIESSGRRVEVQIRTREMNEIAEYGFAAHWKYKDELNNSKSLDGVQYRWIRELLEILEHGGNPKEFLENTKLEMYQDQVFCFSPKGELYSLPTGSTPVDFAYAVHTQIGDNCVGAKVNGRIIPLRSVLKNGDQVEIMVSTAQTPSPIWLNFVATGKARSAIRRFIRDQQLSEYVDLGKAILERSFSNSNLDNNKKNIFRARKIFEFKTDEELFASIGEGLISGKHVIDAINPENFEQKSFVRSLAPNFFRNAINKVRHGQSKGGDHSIPIKGLIPGMAVHLATCCHPLIGDRIVGIQTPGRGITVHTIDCASLENFGSVPENWLDVSWDKSSDEISYLVGRIKLTLTNEPGALHAVTGIVSSNLGNINNILIANRSEDYFDFRFDIEVRDVKHLTEIIAALRAEPMVHNVDRLRE
ncbi:MAG: bifunctional (p)ppGpp synthetase/guanosine-3',5'-bis(diphosphate) 3'-pyrophosphohydrolase [Rhodospirillaceae bacterium]|nr:bifunctional (p)ppGpp synthetase/guanosine-3',5'-bis(diphosphate) 3'-pyrophosphohydrolase [Rhodospirillaceae bacterium]|tara:strand:- start:106 stop:2286 length:2181 start_codon:yes stop_codon:yes gene_type:complete